MTLITVTQEDIAQGTPSSSTYCPIALACDRAGIHPEVYVSRIDALDIPDVAATFIQAFDENETVYPFTFEFADEYLPA